MSELDSIESTGGRQAYFAAADGAEIRYAAWRAERDPPAGAVVYFNGRTEFIEKNLDTVQALLARGFDVWTLDWRGQGLSSRALPNREKGYIAEFGQFLSDIHVFFARCVEPEARGPWVLLAHSMGGQIALRTLYEHPERFACAVLSSPLVDIHRSNTFMGPVIRGLGWLGGWPLFNKNYLPLHGDYGQKDQVFDGNGLTSDPERFRRTRAYIDSNPDLALGGPTFGWLHAANRSITTVRGAGYPEAITTPVLIASASADRIVSNVDQWALAERVPHWRLVAIEGARHEILLERDIYRDEFWRHFDDFVPDKLG